MTTENIWAASGTQCVCVTDFWVVNGIEGPAPSEILTISEVYINPAGLVTLRFVEHHGWLDEESGKTHGYNVRNFRPLVPLKQDVEMFEQIAGREVVRGQIQNARERAAK